MRRSPRRARTNPRRSGDVGKPWDVNVSLEYLPPEVAAAARLALEQGHIAWAGAWAPTLPARTAHLYVRADHEADASLLDALTEAQFEGPQGSVLDSLRWTWRATEPPRVGSRSKAAMRTRTIEEWRTREHLDALFYMLTLHGTHQLLVLAACASARWALRLVPSTEPSALVAIERAEAWTRGRATVEEVRAAVREAAQAGYQYGGSYHSAAPHDVPHTYLAFDAAIDAARTVWALEYNGPSPENRAQTASIAAFAAADAYASQHRDRYRDRSDHDWIQAISHLELCDVIRFAIDPFHQQEPR